ncbi:hypothetical protein D9M72_524600 [compost metagenome]
MHQRHQFTGHGLEAERPAVLRGAPFDVRGQRPHRRQRAPHEPDQQPDQHRQPRGPRQHLRGDIGQDQLVALADLLADTDTPAGIGVVEVVEPPGLLVDGDIGKALDAGGAWQQVALGIDMQRLAVRQPRRDGQVAQPGVALVAFHQLRQPRSRRRSGDIDQRDHRMHLQRHAHHVSVIELVDLMPGPHVGQADGQQPHHRRGDQHRKDEPALQRHMQSSAAPSV